LAQTTNPNTDLFQTLKHRRTTRDFTQTPLPNDVLTRLLYAARRAPSGGNVDTRRFIIVTDRSRIEAIRKASPGFYGSCPVLLVICTDVAAAEGDSTAIFDAGASAENVALAATALGIGVGFVKSYPEIAVKTVLGIPESIRTEIIIKLGTPDPNQPKPPKATKPPMFLNDYGKPYPQG
jgi:nitroreductase